MDYLVDTTFLIHRRRDGERSPEQRFIDSHPASVVGLSWIVKGEFLRGAVTSGHPMAEVAALLDRYQVIWPDNDTLALSARIHASLRSANRLIGPNDLWVAAAAV